ncbi:hypothetical protein [Methanolobus sp. WCC4]|uniref:hypothetical protein n=1 Tax=Methanolobus sp. WCC4 TaxID=3125784 RepID=UPI0030F71473
MEVPKDPVALEQANRQTLIDNLSDVYNSLEKLIQRTYAKRETELNFQLRNIRTSASQLLADIKSKDLDSFSGKNGTLDEFYSNEEQLLQESARIKDEFSSSISSENIDTFMLEGLLDSFKRDLDNRIVVDKDMQKEFKLRQMEADSAERVMSGERPAQARKDSEKEASSRAALTGRLSEPGRASRTTLGMSKTSENSITTDVRTEKASKEDIGTDTLSRLYNYVNVLEHKYSTQQPEISFNGEYTGDRKWKVSISDRSVSGTVMDNVLKPLLTFETYWHPFDDLRTIMDFVQKEANSVPSGQYKSVCLLSPGWNPDILEWAKTYVHPRLVIYLCDLGTNEITFNANVNNSDRLRIWHDLETYVPLEKQIVPLIEQDEPFDAPDVAEITGLSAEGAQKLIVKMLSKKTIIDVGFGTSRYSGMKDR